MSGTRPEAHGWRLQVTLSRVAFEALEAALEDHADAVVAETIEAAHLMQEAPADVLRVTLFGAASADEDPRPNHLRDLLSAAGVEPDDTAVEPVRPVDWRARSLASFPPVSVGRFRILGAHQSPPRQRFDLCVDAGAAFGSGRHESTQGCLFALDWLARRRQVTRAFDIGTGSGILAVAAARLWPTRVLALDSDPAAVAAARETVRQNGLSRRVTVMRGEGSRVGSAGRIGRSDLIVANLRAKPIAAMAPAFARHLRPGGAAVLSGLIATEERLVLAAFCTRGLRLRQRMRLGAWVTLILTR
ncbi:MAG: 50S ribosomal protein L11 methyltransferase [Rhodospirillales bacterium]|nr:50S ribosomal protein L11 methyltransferase [Rhodospirillales bacterium]